MTDMSAQCKNCGKLYEDHKAKTLQCPVGGVGFNGFKPKQHFELKESTN